jgi:hypothetical protein
VKLDWKTVGAAGTVIAGLAVMHGLTSGKWRRIHTLRVLLGVAAAIALQLGL